MCGIVGEVGGRGENLDVGVGRLRHRGPDASGQRVFKGCSLGHTRLRIVDLRAEADQPMANEDGSVWVVFNGEIYNHLELRRSLIAAGHQFQSSSDTEVLVHLYEDLGDAMVERLSGMFAFGLWDDRRQRLLLARDRLGIKPLYLRFEGEGLAFASEVQALRRGDDVIDDAAIDAYLGLGWVPGPGTVERGIEELPAGHLLTWEVGRTTARRYAQPQAAAEVPSTEDLGAALRQAVARQLVADVPVGVFLSSGIDSTVLARLAHEVDADVRALTVSFDGLPGDEAAGASEIAKAIGVAHEVVTVPAGSIAASAADALASFDQPTVDGMNTWLIAKAVRERGIVVALSGIGGDELFCGYSTFRHAPRIADLPGGPFRRLIDAGLPSAQRVPVLAHTRTQRVAAAVSTGGLGPAWAAVRAVFSPAEIRRLRPDRPRPQGWGVSSPREGGRSGVARLELGHYLPYQLLRDGDAMSMAHALEVRVPLLDDLVVPLALAGIDGDPTWSKARLLEAVDPSLLWMAGRPKQTFTLPFDSWMRGELRDLSLGGLALLDLAGLGFDPRALTAVWDGYIGGRVSWRAVWALVALGHWAERRRTSQRTAA